MVSKFVIATARKNELRNYLTVNQIQTKENYAKPLIAMPQATVNCERFLSIPCDSYTTNKEASMIVEAFKMFFEPVPFKTQL
jgi:dTDP-4-amino-4,6-dideoxygalactose transaminase